MTNEKIVHVFPCAALSGCFLAGLIVTWNHSVVNELQECYPIDSLIRIYSLLLKNYLFYIHLCCRNWLGLGANSWRGPNYACRWIKKKRFLFRCALKALHIFKEQANQSCHCSVGYLIFAALSVVSLFRFARSRSARKRFFHWPWTT